MRRYITEERALPKENPKVISQAYEVKGYVCAELMLTYFVVVVVCLFYETRGKIRMIDEITRYSHIVGLHVYLYYQFFKENYFGRHVHTMKEQ